jgi:glycosyltransferase involved in cell wall biosynthesis
VLAVDAGGPAELIEDGRSGCLVAPDAESLAGALRGLARREAIRERLATGGLLAVGDRSWPRSLDQLADGYARALAIGTADEARNTSAATGEADPSGVIARAA